MRTQRVGTLDIDRERLQADLETSAGFPYSDAYSEYLCGGPWRSCVLWAAGGDAGDGLVTNYDFGRAPGPTRHLRELPYVSELIGRWFNLRYLTMARLAVISDSVIIPHRDLLELGDVPEHARNTHRLHVPLVTNDHCFFMHGNIVYRMRFGEVWFFDAASLHSAASFTPEKRVHLMLDFADVDDGRDLVNLPLPEEPGIPPDSVWLRPTLPDGEAAALRALAAVLDADNYRDVFSIVIKKHYRRDGGPDFIWRTMLALAEASGRPDVQDRIREMHRYFLIERAA